jgi:hypothetical protein
MNNTFGRKAGDLHISVKDRCPSAVLPIVIRPPKVQKAKSTAIANTQPKQVLIPTR